MGEHLSYSLQNRLKQLDPDANVTIWRDRKLAGADVFSDQVLDRLKTSAVLISILSPNGVGSDWCQQERQRFEQFPQTSGGIRAGNKMRAIKVVKTPLERSEHRSMFGTLGFEFYQRNNQSGDFSSSLNPAHNLARSLTKWPRQQPVAA